MHEINRTTEIQDIAQKLDSIDYKSIKPEGTINPEESKNFWSNIFSDKVKEKNLELSNYSVNEIKNNLFEDIKSPENTLLNMLSDSKAFILEKLKENNLFIDNEQENLSDKNLETDQKLKDVLSDEEKIKIKEESGWSDEVVNFIKSWKEYEIYKNANLHEAEVNGRKCLVKSIDLNYIDEKTGLTNKELMAKGRSPIDVKTGEKIELHHMGQSFEGPFVELTENSEHGGKNHSILHDNSIESFRRNPELKNQYQNHEKPNYWKSRANEGEN